MSEELRIRYRLRYQDVLVPVAQRLEAILRDHLEGEPRIDTVRTRAKTVESFLQKAGAVDQRGEAKYVDPTRQIQDQIGARVVVFYADDVQRVVDVLARYLLPVEDRNLIPESPWEFGYFGRHFVMALPADAIPRAIERDTAPTFFELQIKTLFQHAWSEANHDLGYKPGAAITSDQKRRLAFTSAQAWGADRLFQELWLELHDRT